MSEVKSVESGLGNGSHLPGSDRFSITSGMSGRVDHDRGVKRSGSFAANWWLNQRRSQGESKSTLAPGTYDTILIFSATVPHEVRVLPAAQNIFSPALPVPT
jgi:hypothetical protein